MKQVEIFYVILVAVIILIFLNLNFHSRKYYKECFSAAPTKIVYSNSEQPNILDRYAKINEEILILEQQPGKENVIKFKYLRAPVNDWIVFYVRKEQENGQITINTFLMQMKEVYINIPQIMRTNNLIVNDVSNTYRYYIKALDEKTYPLEKEKDDKKKALMARYQECVNLKKTTNSPAVAVAECRKEYRL